MGLRDGSTERSGLCGGVEPASELPVSAPKTSVVSDGFSNEPSDGIAFAVECSSSLQLLVSSVLVASVSLVLGKASGKSERKLSLTMCLIRWGFFGPRFLSSATLEGKEAPLSTLAVKEDLIVSSQHSTISNFDSLPPVQIPTVVNLHDTSWCGVEGVSSPEVTLVIGEEKRNVVGALYPSSLTIRPFVEAGLDEFVQGSYP